LLSLEFEFCCFLWSIEALFGNIEARFFGYLLFFLLVQILFTFGGLRVLSISNSIIDLLLNLSLILSSEMFDIERIILICINFPLNISL
jgi:hypothetical protein